jgi:hypothetical protein
MEKITVEDKKRVRCLSPFDKELSEKDKILLYIRDSIAGVHTVGNTSPFSIERVYNIVKGYSEEYKNQAIQEYKEKLKESLSRGRIDVWDVVLTDGSFVERKEEIQPDGDYLDFEVVSKIIDQVKPCPSSNHSTQEG